MKFKAHFKLEFDIKTNSDNMPKILETIAKNVEKELLETEPMVKTEIELIPTIIKIDIN